jgi:chorismate-pyruvate lyase
LEDEKRREYAYDPLRGFISKERVPASMANRIRFQEMNPFLRALLVTDGTVTKFLEAYLWEPISVERIFQKEIVLKEANFFLETKKGEPVTLRKILLRGVWSSKVYTFAESLIRIHLLEEEIQRDLLEGRLGLGELLRDRRLETYREMLEFGKEEMGEELAAYFGAWVGSPIYFRRYRIQVKGKGVILVTEKFYEPHLPKLEPSSPGSHTDLPAPSRPPL